MLTLLLVPALFTRRSLYPRSVQGAITSVRYLLDDEERRLLSVLTGPRGHLLPLVVLAIGTGMRRGDLFNLTWEKVDFQRGVIYGLNSKTGRDYSVPMNEDVRSTLR
jgi:integrase